MLVSTSFCMIEMLGLWMNETLYFELLELDILSSFLPKPKSYDRRGHLSDPHETGLFMNRKSQDAAVGALVRMLKRAPPLRQDVSSSTNFSEASRPEIWSKSIHEQNQILEVFMYCIF
ncbi:Uncharacterized protein TCM_001377 [Theobroma cacao]|uniref:Uncharacterized protein n=1 Tax=Theobroma cacao TaxID=3641 RepID=A0A061DR35_THECC|nr:Uncharacterized protein TCM_001377 [Theobroma cacao]